MLGTQLCAGFYLFSWTVSQALIWAAGNEWNSGNLPVLPPGRVDDVASQGLSPWIFSVAGVLLHCHWLDCLSMDINRWRLFFRRIEAVGPALSSSIWALITTILIAVLPFIIWNTDSSRSLKLTDPHLAIFPAFAGCMTLLVLFWQETVFPNYVPVTSRSYAMVYSGVSKFSPVAWLIVGPHAVLNLFLCALHPSVRLELAGATNWVIMVTWYWQTDVDRSDRPLFYTVCFTTGLHFLVMMIMLLGGRSFQPVWKIGRLTLPAMIWLRLADFVAIFLVFGPVPLLDDGPEPALLIAMVSYGSLTWLNYVLGADGTRFSSNLAGISFVASTSLWPLAWYACVWPWWENKICTIRPGWTNLLG